MKNRLWVTAGITLLVLRLSGCERMAGRSITVEFRNAEGLRGGEAVYLAGVRVGTAGKPKLSAGHAIVPVTISRRHRDAVPGGTVFLLKRDPQDSSRFALTGVVCSETPPGQQPPRSYRGARNRLEFLGMCGAAKAAEIFEELIQ
jgi:hypothetical protein